MIDMLSTAESLNGMITKCGFANHASRIQLILHCMLSDVFYCSFFLFLFFCRIIGETFASWKSIMIIWIIAKTFPTVCPFAGSENIISNIMVCSTSLCMFFFQSSADLEFKRGMCRHDLQSSFCQIT